MWTFKSQPAGWETGFHQLCFPPPEDNTNLFREEGVANYTTMLLREDLDMLLVGAREAIYALDLKDISKKRASVRAPHIQAVPP